MGKHIPPMKDHSGDKVLYEYEEGLVESLPTFTYELCLYKIWKKGYCQLDSRVFKTNELIRIKNNSIITRFDGFIIEKEISLIGVPEKFINDMNLKIYIPKPKVKKRCKKQS